MSSKPIPSGSRHLAANRKARRDYAVIETYEAGIELRGTEVKSIREARVSLSESHARIENGELLLVGMRIEPYDHGNRFNHDPARTRRLLMHRNEIDRLWGLTSRKGHTLVPLSLYLKRGRVKVELALCRGRDRGDKREVLKRKTAEREAARAMADARRR